MGDEVALNEMDMDTTIDIKKMLLGDISSSCFPDQDVFNNVVHPGEQIRESQIC